ncbi:MAG: alpha-hydroxy-acid oxidizing protein [Burkholderiales bacterium]|nr:alpha-hydroxy-acid oxidizing protein [Burkholderiales bacterium]
MQVVRNVAKLNHGRHVATVQACDKHGKHGESLRSASYPARGRRCTFPDHEQHVHYGNATPRSVSALAAAISIADLRRLAQRRLPRSVFEFIDGGAEDEVTLADNRAAFERIRFVPRILNDVSAPDLAADLFGATAAAPLVISPMGSCALAWPDADLAIARAAGAHGIPYTLSTMANTSIERMAAAAPGPLWFQLYVLEDHAFNRKLVERARGSGYSALVVTVDLQAGGKRERDLRNGIAIPLRIGVRQVADGLLHPRWALGLARGGLPVFENVHGLFDEGTAGLTIAARVGENLDAAFDWDRFQRLRDAWPGTLIVKGVAHPQDATRLIDAGADGLWISNHGGRQLDGAIASVDALARIAPVTHGRVPLILDSGVRRGSDILKARALGATAAGIGRAALYGASVGGEAGVRHALAILTDELTRAMKLSGTPSLAAADRTLLA